MHFRFEKKQNVSLKLHDCKETVCNTHMTKPLTQLPSNNCIIGCLLIIKPRMLSLEKMYLSLILLNTVNYFSSFQ